MAVDMLPAIQHFSTSSRAFLAFGTTSKIYAMRNIFYVIWLCLGFCSVELSAQEKLIVPFELGDKWVYRISKLTSSQQPLDAEGNKVKSDEFKEIWTVTGDSLIEGRTVKSLRVDRYRLGVLELSYVRAIAVDSTKMQYWATECSGDSINQWKNYLNTEIKDNFQDSLVCYGNQHGRQEGMVFDSTQISFTRSPEPKRPTGWFDTAVLIENWRRDNSDMEGWGHSWTDSAPGIGIITSYGEYFTPFFGHTRYSTTTRLLGAVIKGEHYGDTRLTTDIPQEDVNAGESYDGLYKISAYPNPIEGPVNFEIKTAGVDVKIRLVSLTGQDMGLIAERVFSETQIRSGMPFISADLGATPPGSYFAVLQVDGIARTHCLLLVL